MKDPRAPYKSNGVSVAEVGLFAEALSGTISPESSDGIKREQGLSLLNVLSAAIKSDGTTPATVESTLGIMSKDQQDAIKKVIVYSGVAENAPTFRERSQAQEVLEGLYK